MDFPPAYQDHELIQTTKIFWHLDQFPEKGWGWPLSVYFDRTSNSYRVFNFPAKGLHLELQELPADGLFDVKVDPPVQYAKDRFTDIVKVKVRDININDLAYLNR